MCSSDLAASPTGGSAGTPGTGGGGGGSLVNGPYGGMGAGGSGVVAIAVPTPYYVGSVMYPAGNVTVTTPPAAPGYTVLTYTASGTFTAAQKPNTYTVNYLVVAGGGSGGYYAGGAGGAGGLLSGSFTTSPSTPYTITIGGGAVAADRKSTRLNSSH